MVVPDGVLFSKDKDSTAVRKILIETCKVEAVIQLDVFTFAPYTKQPTSILIFEKGGRTEKVWFFDLLNDGFTKSVKRKPSDKNDLPIVRTLWSGRESSEHSFSVDYARVDKIGYKLFLNFYKAYKPVKDAKEIGEICEEPLIGGTPDTKNIEYYGTKHLWATIADLKEREVTDTVTKLSDAGALKLGVRRKVKKGTLLMSFKLTLGKTAFAGGDLYTNEAICALIPKKEFNDEETREYLYHILPIIDYTPYAQRAAKGLTLNKELIPNVQVPFPSKSVRAKIVKKLEVLTEAQMALKAKLEQSILDYQKFSRNIAAGE